jgi:hypothetical protein
MKPERYKDGSIFEFADKFGYKKSPFGNWMEEERLAREQREQERAERAAEKEAEKEDLNDIELDFVKFLFKIRNANYYKQSIPYERFFTSNPNGNTKRERVFIAGKVFPILNLFYSGEAANASKIELKELSMYERVLLFGDTDYRLYNPIYISIDNNKIKIFLPPSYSDVNFPSILLDFLINGPKTTYSIGGEFDNYETYKLALRDKAQPLKTWKGEDGSWLFSDRDKNLERWVNGYSYIIKDKIQGRLAPFKQIGDFYNALDNWVFRLGHQVKWCKGAKSLVNVLAINKYFKIGGLEGGSIAVDNDIETILNELNLGICDYAITQFHDLIYGKYAQKPLKGDDAYNWDVAFIIYEQQKVAPPIYSKTSEDTLKKYQKMANKDPYDVDNGLSSLGAGSLLFNGVMPAFDDFTPEAKVTDDLFRTDLPLLMLYLDKHKIDKNNVSPSLKNYLNEDGTVNEDCKAIIRPFRL